MESIQESESWLAGKMDEDQAFAEWVYPHLRSMRLLAIRLAPPGDADDLVQEALLRAWTKRGTFDPARGTVAGWLLAITADRCRRARRSWRPLQFIPFRRRPISADERVDIEAAVRQLTPRQRLAIDCYYFADLSVDDTATVMRCSSGTVKSTLFDARMRLRALIEAS